MRFSHLWLGALAACGLAAVGLPGTITTLAQTSGGTAQAGPFEVGNLLDYANSDFEGTTGNWTAVSNATLTDDPNASFLHDDSLLDTATTAGTSSFALGGSSAPIRINLTPGAEYRVGAYFKAPVASGQTVQFSLGCYDASGASLGLSKGTVNSLLDTTNWQYSEDDITIPSNCAYVLGSPMVTLGGLAADAAVNMDEAAFMPYRAAQIIGAHGNGVPYTAGAWLGTNRTIGALQSSKEFWNETEYLPNQWNEPSNSCYEIELSVPNSANWPSCIIAYKDQESVSQIAAFFANLPTAQMVIMVYYNEPEGNFPSGAQFVSEFEAQSNNIRAAASDAPNIFVAEDSLGYQYGSRSSDSAGTGCGYIVNPAYTDFYLDDHYDQGANGMSLPDETSGPTGDSDGQKWLNWLGCVQSMNKPLGLAEYGLDCTTNPDQPVVTDEMSADDKYLGAVPGATEPTIMWEYWYEGDCKFGNSAGGITAWKSFETQNEGG
jgi:Carbohydrate binding domain